MLRYTTNMYAVLAIVGSLVAAAGTVPYIIETIQKKAKPRVVSWLTWALLTGLAGAAALADGQIAAALFAFAGTLATTAVFITGWRYGDRSFTKLDITCMSGVIVGLTLWLSFDSPALAIWGSIVIDFIGFVPTYVHAWKKPKEETPLFFALAATGGLVSTIAAVPVGGWTVTSVAYPLYVAISMIICLAILIVRTPSFKDEPAPRTAD